MNAIYKAIIFCLALAVAATGNSAKAESTEIDNRRITYSPPNSFGIGVGLAFGGVGISYDRALNQRFTLTAAIGDHALAPDLTYALGAKVFIHKGKIWQTRMTVLYGTNTLVNTACELFCLIRHYEQFEGFSLGFGQRFVIGGGRGKHSIDVDVFYAVAASDAKDLVAETDALFENESGMHLSLGYRYYF